MQQKIIACKQQSIQCTQPVTAWSRPELLRAVSSDLCKSWWVRGDALFEAEDIPLEGDPVEDSHSTQNPVDGDT